MENEKMVVYKICLEPFDDNPLIVSEKELPCLIEEAKVLDGDDRLSVEKTTMLKKDFDNLKEHRGW